MVLVSTTSLVQEGYSHHTCGDSGLTVFFPVYFNICFMSGELKMGYDFIQGSGPGEGLGSFASCGAAAVWWVEPSWEEEAKLCR